MYKPPKEALFHKSAWLFSDLMVRLNGRAVQCTEVLFDSFLSGGFTTMAVINPPERKLAKRTTVQWGDHFGKWKACYNKT